MNGRAAWGGAASPCLSNNSFQTGCCLPCWHLQSKLVVAWAGLSRLGQGTEALPGRLGSAPALAGTVGPSQALPRPPFAPEVGCLCRRRGCRSPNLEWPCHGTSGSLFSGFQSPILSTSGTFWVLSIACGKLRIAQKVKTLQLHPSSPPPPAPFPAKLCCATEGIFPWLPSRLGQLLELFQWQPSVRTSVLLSLFFSNLNVYKMTWELC